MADEKNLWSAVEIAEDLGVQLHNVIYTVDKIDLRSVLVIGGRRVYTQKQKDLIADELAKKELPSS